MTEKDYNPEQKQRKAMNKQKAANKAAVKNVPKASEKEVEKKIEEEKVATPEPKAEEKKPEVENKVKEKPKKEIPKKTEAVVRANDVPISTKHSKAICDFIRHKELGTAIEQLENVLKMKIAIPMKGEIPHRKGKGMMSGRYPIKATERFLKLLRSLASNAVYNGLENPVIEKAVANLGARPYGRFGAVRKKRTHLEIVVKDKVNKSPVKKSKPKKEKGTKKQEDKVEDKKDATEEKK